MLPPQFHVYVHPTDTELKKKAQDIVTKLISFGYEPLVYLDRQPNQADFCDTEGGLVYDGYASARQPYHNFGSYIVNPNHYIICLQIYQGTLNPFQVDFLMHHSRHIYFNEPVPIVENPLVLIPGLHKLERGPPENKPAPVHHVTTIHADGSISHEDSLLSFDEHCKLYTEKHEPSKRRLEIN